jgi:tRNA pseudouridine38-40 synthase
MARYKLTIEYDGGPFVGWQRQDNGPTVQDALETAIFKFCGETVTASAAGRTDTGVHALGQVAHIDVAKDTTPDTVRDAINAHLRPQPVSVISAECVTEEFHARFSAKARHYLYRILTRRSPPAIERGRVWHIMHPLDVEAMHAASQLLVGHHDFTTFRAVGCQAKSPVKTLDRLDVSRAANEITVSASARSFLHHQVRSMVGALKFVGEGKWTTRDLKRALDAKDRAACAPLAPPEGLYLVRVDY